MECSPEAIIGPSRSGSDAIKGTGTIVIRTETAVISDEYKGQIPEAKPGVYAVLSVDDTGCGSMLAAELM